MIDYNKVLTDEIQSIKPSGIRKFFDMVDKAKGDPEIISLGIGEPDFTTPWHIRQAGIESLNRGETHYTSNAGLTEMREEASKYLTRRFGIAPYNHENEIIITVGGSEAIDLTLRCLVNDGDEVIIPEPSFVCYQPLTRITGGIPVVIETKNENEFRITAEELKAAITPKTKLLVLPYPCNPTGAVMRHEDLEAVAEILRDTNIMVLADEIYAELTYSRKHESIVQFEGMRERTVLISGFSKAYAMTGWRLGYLCTPEPIAKMMLKLHQYGIMSAPTMAQFAAIEALQDGDADIEMMKDEYDSRRRFLLSEFKRMGLPCFDACGAFYLFPDIRAFGLTSTDFCEKLFTEEKLAVIPGGAFGESGEGFVRVCYAQSMKKIEEAVIRIERFIKKMK